MRVADFGARGVVNCRLRIQQGRIQTGSHRRTGGCPGNDRRGHASRCAGGRRPQATPAPALKTIRIDAGSDTNYTDFAGNVWLADQGFADGEMINRDDNLRLPTRKSGAVTGPSIIT